MSLGDAGLASEYWKRYYDPDEIELLIEHTATTNVTSGHYPLHVRLFEHSREAPTVVFANSLLGYGLIQARQHLPFFRAGFNVVQFDFPGLGQSGGPRGGGTIPEFLRAWRDVVDFAYRRYERPLFVMGVAEDGVAAYHATANSPLVRAISVHVLFEYGEPGGVHWLGSARRIRLLQGALGILALVRPTLSIPASQSAPWDRIHEGPDDERMRDVMGRDPLALQRVQLRMASSLMRTRQTRVPFEQCETPVQVVATDRNRLWPYEMVKRNFERLGGPKELITLEGKPMWQLDREFVEDYCSHAVRWFRAHDTSDSASGVVQPGRGP
jgi:pimeloyl-ACP methyl ester carboxylesterase